MLCLELEPLNNRPSSSLRSASFCDPFPSLHPPQPSRARKGRQRRPPENGAQVPRLLSRDSEPAHEPKARGRHDVRGRVWKLPARAQELGGTGRHFPPPNSHGHKAGRDCCCLRRSGYLGLRRRPYRTHSSAKGVQKRRQNRQCTPLGQPRQPASTIDSNPSTCASPVVTSGGIDTPVQRSPSDNAFGHASVNIDDLFAAFQRTTYSASTHVKPTPVLTRTSSDLAAHHQATSSDLRFRFPSGTDEMLLPGFNYHGNEGSLINASNLFGSSTLIGFQSSLFDGHPLGY